MLGGTSENMQALRFKERMHPSNCVHCQSKVGQPHPHPRCQDGDTTAGNHGASPTGGAVLVSRGQCLAAAEDNKVGAANWRQTDLGIVSTQRQCNCRDPILGYSTNPSECSGVPSDWTKLKACGGEGQTLPGCSVHVCGCPAVTWSHFVGVNKMVLHKCLCVVLMQRCCYIIW